jgi:hypothetical protein
MYIHIYIHIHICNIYIYIYIPWLRTVWHEMTVVAPHVGVYIHIPVNHYFVHLSNSKPRPLLKFFFANKRAAFKGVLITLFIDVV